MSKLPLEIKALEELEKLNVSELYGRPISELAQLSISRREGAGKLREAYESFSVDDLSAEKIKSVGKKLSEAVAALKRAQKGYSTIDELQIVVRIIDAQLAEAETLQRSIDLWWQGQIFAQLNQARLHLAQPTTPEGIQKGEAHLDEAKHLLEQWKSGKEFTHRAGNEPKEKNQESIYQETQDAIAEVEKLLKENRSALVEVRMAEVEHWLKIAEEYLPQTSKKGTSDEEQLPNDKVASEADGDGNSQPSPEQLLVTDKLESVDFTAIYAAMSCLSQAKILLHSLTSKHDNGQTSLPEASVGRASPSAEQVKTLWDRYTDLSDKARQALRQGMGARRRQIDEWVKKIEKEVKSNPNKFLKDADNCDLVDGLRYNLYLFPDIQIPPNVQQVIMQRVENVQESRRILWQVQAEEKEKGTYWAYRELERAKSLNPGDKNIEKEAERRRSEWGEKQRQFSKLVEKVKKVYETYYGKRTPLQILAKYADQEIGKTEKLIQQLRESYEAEGKPEAWQKDFSTAKQQAYWLTRWLETAKQLKELVDNWKKACEVEKDAPMVDDELLTQTESFIEEIKKHRIWFPPEVKSALLKAIEKALGSSNGNEIFANLSMVKRTFQLKEQLEKLEV